MMLEVDGGGYFEYIVHIIHIGQSVPNRLAQAFALSATLIVGDPIEAL